MLRTDRGRGLHRNTRELNVITLFHLFSCVSLTFPPISNR